MKYACGGMRRSSALIGSCSAFRCGAAVQSDRANASACKPPRLISGALVVRASASRAPRSVCVRGRAGGRGIMTSSKKPQIKVTQTKRQQNPSRNVMVGKMLRLCLVTNTPISWGWAGLSSMFPACIVAPFAYLFTCCCLFTYKWWV